ncbi:hemolysin family protein [Corynebacterium auriscanis]|uniref:hemolysin family protein n=1 Tax=Corynebacterium auriscanis TaxID=99807 RepID=UPI0022454919|nr:hemolysin family protein [Corynebacterium auriscanis]MCX2163396.1 hemolysin family protein [Corynebacterium auriscanis]
MDSIAIFGPLGVFLALLMGGALSLVETAVSAISRARVEVLVKDEKPGAGRLLDVIDNRAQHINLLILLRTVCEAAGAVLAAGLLLTWRGDSASTYVIAIVAVTVITFVVIGVLSRTLGRQNPYSISLKTAPLLLGMRRLLGPIAKLLVAVGNFLAPGRGFRDGPFATEVELRELVDIASERGIVERDERRMIQSVFDLASTSARSVMVPRPEMLWIESDKTAGQATSLCVRSGHSRLPVIGEDVDDIVGVVYLKDLVAKTYYSQDGGRSVSVSDVMRPPVFVPDSRNLDDLLEDMQRDQVHIAMLVDEYGAIAGLISIEDILEEIVGEIADEYDATEMAPIEELGDGKYRVVARLSLEELQELFAESDRQHFLDHRGDDPDEIHDSAAEISRHTSPLEFSEEQLDEVDTVAGLGAFELGRVPIPGAEVTTAGLHIVYEGGRDRRGRLKIRSAVVSRVAESAESER